MTNEDLKLKLTHWGFHTISTVGHFVSIVSKETGSMIGMGSTGHTAAKRIWRISDRVTRKFEESGKHRWEGSCSAATDWER